jgi:ribosome biogenesis GTPase A
MKEATELARKGKRNVFVVGSTNAGKSTLVNSLLKRKYIVPLKTKSLASVTASSYPGTTLAPIPFGLMGPSVSVVSGERKQKRIKKCALFDCPGVIQSGHLNHMLNFAELKNVQIQSKIQPIQLKVRSGQHLLLGALGSIQLLSDLSVWATCFTSKRISLHVTASDNFESLLSDKVGSVIYPPFRPERMKELPKWNSREIEFDPGELPKNKYRSVFDIWFSGLGWVNIQARGKGKIRVQSPGYYEFADPIPTRFEPYLKIDRFKGRSPTGMSEKELKRHRISPL